MPRRLIWTGRILLVLAVVLAALALWKRPEITRHLAVNRLFDTERMTTAFSQNDAFPHVPLPRGEGAVSALPYGTQWRLPADVAGWMARRKVTAMVVLRGGAIVAESHIGDPLGPRLSWELSQALLSALTGVLVAEGTLNPGDPVTAHVPGLARGPYDGLTLGQILDRGLDPDTADLPRIGRSLAWGAGIDALATGRHQSDAQILAMVLRAATGESLPDLLTRHLVTPMGFQVDPHFLTDTHGTALAGTGLALTTRDLARFGQMIANGGIWQGAQLVPADWIDGISAESSRLWTIPENAAPGEFLMRGAFGQYLYINRALGVVIAVHAADPDHAEAGIAEESLTLLRSIAARVAAMPG